MLKKGTIIATIGLIMALSVTGCGKGARQSRQGQTKSSASRVVTADYGRFSIPKGWKKDAEHSTEANPFFVPDDYNGDGVPNNISVEYGHNHYAKGQATEFGRAIMRQLAVQTQGRLTGQLTASGTTTKTGETVLVFRMPTADRVNTQYYIVGEQCHVMVYETNLDGSEECDAAARKIVDSFKWKP